LSSTIAAPLPMSTAITRFIAHADTDSLVVKQALEQRTGVPVRLNPQTTASTQM
jgi:L,D-transpeptidase YbiS